MPLGGYIPMPGERRNSNGPLAITMGEPEVHDPMAPMGFVPPHGPGMHDGFVSSGVPQMQPPQPSYYSAPGYSQFPPQGYAVQNPYNQPPRRRAPNKVVTRLSAAAAIFVVGISGLVVYANSNSGDAVASDVPGGTTVGGVITNDEVKNVKTGFHKCKDGSMKPFVAGIDITDADLEKNICDPFNLLEQIKKDANTPMVDRPWERPLGTSRTTGCNKYKEGERVVCESIKYLDIYYKWAGGHLWDARDPISYKEYLQACPDPRNPKNNKPNGAGSLFNNGNPSPCGIDCSGLARFAILDSYRSINRDWLVAGFLNDSKNFDKVKVSEVELGDLVMQGDYHVEVVISKTKSKKTGKWIINTIGTRKTGTLSSFYSDTYDGARRLKVPELEKAA